MQLDRSALHVAVLSQVSCTRAVLRKAHFQAVDNSSSFSSIARWQGVKAPVTHTSPPSEEGVAEERLLMAKEEASVAEEEATMVEVEASAGEAVGMAVVVEEDGEVVVHTEEAVDAMGEDAADTTDAKV